MVSPRPWTHRIVVSIAALCFAALSFAASAEVFVSVAIAPPPLPVYVQPVAPGPGYIWTPGYWAYGPVGYYWVPGTWVLAPFVGALWTPGYWGWSAGRYYWHAGYWGPRVGFYGGVNYGFGYYGAGYTGGYWRDNAFYYNRAVNNVDVTQIHTTYRTNIVNQPVSRTSYNNGPGGIARQPNAVERSIEGDRHVNFTESQQRHETLAASNPQLQASANRGRPTIAATPAPGTFDHPNVVAARGASAPNAVTTYRPQGTQSAGMPRSQGVNGAGGAQPQRTQSAPSGAYPAGPPHSAPPGYGMKNQSAPQYGEGHAEPQHSGHGGENPHGH